MRSGELAHIAAVTPRTLRHYHQIGVLAEPERDLNGYRRYTVHDLIRVLRIRRLVSLGVPLEQIPEMLADEASDSTVLDHLDAELAKKIEQLSQQRDLIARLKEIEASPDLPPELAPFLMAFSKHGQSPDLARIDREHSVLIAHLAGDSEMPRLVKLYERLADPELAPQVVAFSERFDTLGAGTTEMELGELVDSFVELFTPINRELAESDSLVDLSGFTSLLSAYTQGMLNEQQQLVLDRITEALED